MTKTFKVAEKLETQIRYGGAIPSTREIASNFNVSYKTAYQAVTELVERKVAYRIKGKGAFALPSSMAPKVKTLGLLWREADEKKAQISIIYKEIITGINLQSGVENLNVRHLICHKHTEAEINDMDMLISMPDIWNNPVNQKLLKKIVCPHLYLGLWKPPIHNGSSLCLDTVQAIEKSLEYLTSIGRKNIALIHHDENEFLGRDVIFSQIKDRLKMSHQPEWEIYSGDILNHEDGFDTGKDLANEIIRKLPAIDGVLCISDHIAGGVYSTVKKENYNLAVMGMDNIEAMGYCYFGKPMLTAIAPEYLELGKLAVQILTNMSMNRSVTYLDCKLKIRKSCGE